LKQRYGLILVTALMLSSSAPALAQQTRVDTAELARQVQALQQLADSLNVRLGKLEGAIQQNQQLLGLLKEVETLRTEVARMRGQAEVQVHQLDTLGKRQNDLYVDLDQRIADIAKQARPAAVAPVESPAVARTQPPPASVQPPVEAMPAQAPIAAAPAATAAPAAPAATRSARSARSRPGCGNLAATRPAGGIAQL
jgi:hypothetical protein